ncbi:MAG: hypothetical protein U5O39_13960 [Gammaproteobacteria bacterium]|nr:hypothetical protein [Gammaproteobacteria bacterium]
MPGELIHIDADPHMIGLNYPPALGIVGDARLALESLTEALNADGGDGEFLEDVQAAANAARQGVRDRMGSDFEAIMETIRNETPASAGYRSRCYGAVLRLGQHAHPDSRASHLTPQYVSRHWSGPAARHRGIAGYGPEGRHYPG